MRRRKGPFGYNQRLPGRDRQTRRLATRHKFPEYVLSSTLYVLTLLRGRIRKSEKRDTGPHAQLTSSQLPSLEGRTAGGNEGCFAPRIPGGQSFPSRSLAQSPFRPWPSSLYLASTIADAHPAGIGLAHLSMPRQRLFAPQCLDVSHSWCPLGLPPCLRRFTDASRSSLRPHASRSSKIIPANMDLFVLSCRFV